MIVLRESKFKKISVEIFCLVISAALIPTNFYIEPHNRGFFCNDQTIMYPRVLKETVSNLTLGIIALIFLILIIIGEIFHARKTRSSQQLLTFKVPNWITLIYHKAGTYLIGGITTVLIGDVIKLTVGRLRPHFLDVCAPNIDCTLATNLNRYVGPGEFVCTSNFTDDLRNARLSFPSSHSSTLTYVGVYFICYLQLRITSRNLKMLKYFLQFIVVSVIWFISMTRISDYFHHWSDVTVGMMIGLVNALITVQLATPFLFRKGATGILDTVSQKPEEHEREKTGS
ncbi:putative phosphatidate phosphatase isoform X2 [Cotesia typhae]|uniref:putative phosphatidate phosphatase isoform X2 n=1 Tax=Cotesia typhae TaxID=2053667 RepID=UPI003D699D64